jgi:hypothetical protein
MNKIILLAMLLLAVGFVSAADYGLNSVTGTWTAVSGGSSVTGIGTNEVRWGVPAETSKSGLRFDGTSGTTFNEGDEFLLGQLTHFNFPTNSGTAADGATLKIVLSFNQPPVSPDPAYTFDFAVLETPNTAGQCPDWQVSSTPCDDKITFPNSYGEQSYIIGDKLYTVKILGYVDSYPGGNPVSEFITEEDKSSTAYLVGILSSVLVEKPQLTLAQKATNGVVAEDAPGPEIVVGDAVEWTYLVQNTGNVALTDVKVTDDQGVEVTCPQTTLQSGEAMTCTAEGTAVLGQYENTASATAMHGQTQLDGGKKTAYYVGVVEQEVPEFGVIAGALALIGALGIIVFKRK